MIRNDVSLTFSESFEFKNGERVRRQFRNADRLVEYSDQKDAR